MTLEQGLSWTERLSALTVLLQTLELLHVRRALADDGVWRFAILQKEHARVPWLLRAALSVCLPYRAFIALLALRLPLSAALGAGVGVAAWPLLLTQLAIGARFRGTFNGGSDSMTMVLLLGLSVAALPGVGATGVRAGLGYIVAQLVLSYFIAGVVKLRRPEWRRGVALAAFLAEPRYAAPRWISSVVAGPGGALVSWCVIAFEVGFPLALLRPEAALVATLLGSLFHLGNAMAFGLNRFFFTWLAAYPALLFFSAALVR